MQALNEVAISSVFFFFFKVIGPKGGEGEI